MNSRLIKEIRSNLNGRAKKKGMEFKGAQLNEFPWIKADACLYLKGLKVDYDIKEDYGNKYPHDTYIAIGNICRRVFGEPCATYPPDYDRAKWSWGAVYEAWNIDGVVVANYIYGHPRSGFYDNFLYIGDERMMKDAVQ